MNGHTRNQLITEFLMHYLKTGSEDDMKAADIIADEVFEHTLKRIDELERQVRMLTTGRENIDGNKIWKKFHSEDISINELNDRNLFGVLPLNRYMVCLDPYIWRQTFWR